MSNRRQKAKPQNTINRQLEQPMVQVREKDENLIQLGKFFYTLASLTYGSAFLGLILNYAPEKSFLLLLSTIGFLILMLSAWMLVKRGNNTTK